MRRLDSETRIRDREIKVIEPWKWLRLTSDFQRHLFSSSIPYSGFIYNKEIIVSWVGLGIDVS